MATVTRGIVLAGGLGSRLYPMTLALSKQMMPVYDKPMIYYPLCTLMQSGIRDILIIATPRDLPAFRTLLGDGSNWGISLDYAEQLKPEGIAQAFVIGKDFIGDRHCALVLGDNLFFGESVISHLRAAIERDKGASVFAHRVVNPQRFGVIELGADGRAISIEEKPAKPKSHYAVTGLYCYDNRVVEIAGELQPSARGELEITDLNRYFLERGELFVAGLKGDSAWFDTGTQESLLAASQYVAAVERLQGIKLACPEEVAWTMGYIDDDRFESLAARFTQNRYGRYLFERLEEGR